MDVSNTRRIAILGKTGTGKSSLGNTIFGETLFEINHTLNSGTRQCKAETRSVNGRSITLIDTPGFFDTDRSEEEMKPEIVRCITECAPGPHAFLIVLKVEKFTEQEQAVITKIHQYFTEEVFKYTTVVFTHGDQIPEEQNIKDFIHKNKLVSDLVEKCKNRCHIVDNKYWNEISRDEYRSNQFQVEALLNTIDTMIEANNGSCYTNEMLQAVEAEIQQEERQIRESTGNMPEQEIREQAKVSVFKKLLVRLAGVGTGVLVGAFFGVVTMVGLVLTILNEKPVQLQEAMTKTAQAAIGVTGEVIAGAAVPLCKLGVASVAAVVGAGKGGVTGYRAAEGADTPWEAARRAAKAVKDDSQSVLVQAHNLKRKVTASFKTESQQE